MADQETSSGTWQGLLTSLIFASIISTILLTIYARESGRCRDYYYPKFYRQQLVYTPNGTRKRLAEHRGPAFVETTGYDVPARWWHRVWLPFGLAAMRKPFFTQQPTGAKTLSNAGVDGQMMITYARLAAAYLTILLLPGIAIAAINATAGGTLSDPLFRFSTDRLEMGSNRLYAHMAAVYIQSALLVALLAYGYRQYRIQRQTWMRQQATISIRTVRVTGVPQTGMTGFMNTGRRVAGGSTIYHSPALPLLDKRVAKYNNGTVELEDLATQLRSDYVHHDGLAVKPYGIVAMLKYYLCCGYCYRNRSNASIERVDSSARTNVVEDVSVCREPTHALTTMQDASSVPRRFYQTKFAAHTRFVRERQELERQIEDTRQNPLASTSEGNNAQPIASGDMCFLTFDQPRDAQLLLARSQNRMMFQRDMRADPALQPIVSTYGQIPSSLHVYPAPEPDDIIWKNYDLKRRQRIVKRCVGATLMTVLIIVAFSPAVFAAALTNLEALGTVIGFLEPVLSWSGLGQGVIQTFLPALLVKVFLALLAPFVRAIGRLAGMLSHRDVELYVLRRFFLLQFVNVVLAITIVSTLFGAMDAIVNDPSSVLTMLADSLPQASGFFVSFVVLEAVSTWPGELADVVGMILYRLKRNGTWTQRKLDNLVDDRQGGVPFGSWGPRASLILAIASLYAFFNPIVLIPAIVYFLVAGGVYRHQMLYVHRRDTDTGGLVWPELAKQAIDGLLLTQILWIAYMFIREVDGAGYALIPLLVMTIVARCWFNYRVAAQARYDADLPIAERAPADLAEYKEMATPYADGIPTATVATGDAATVKGDAVYVRSSLLAANDMHITRYEPEPSTFNQQYANAQEVA